MNIVWRFFTVASLPVCVLYCLLYCSGPAVSGCGCLLVRAGDGWENPLPGCPGCPGFCSLCLSYRNRPVKPLALFLKKSRSPPRDPAMAVLGELVFPSAASLFGQATGPLGRPKKSDAPLLPHPPRPSDPSHCSPGGPGSYSASAQAGGCFPVGARPPGRSGSIAAPQPPIRPSGTGHSPSNQTASQWG